MLQPCRGFDLAKEAVGPDGRRQLGVQHLDGDRTTVLQIVGQEHRRHAPPANFPLDAIPRGERVTEDVEEAGHECEGAP